MNKWKVAGCLLVLDREKSLYIMDSSKESLGNIVYYIKMNEYSIPCSSKTTCLAYNPTSNCRGPSS